MIACLIAAAWMSCTNLVAPASAAIFYQPAVSAQLIATMRARALPVGLTEPLKLAPALALAVAELAPRALATGDQSSEARGLTPGMVALVMAGLGALASVASYWIGRSSTSGGNS
jgi:hypothetical protein